jgi:hypothetical protein
VLALWFCEIRTGPPDLLPFGLRRVKKMMVYRHPVITKAMKIKR